MSHSKINHSSGLVYSTGIGRLCPDCGNAIDACTCKRAKPMVKGGNVRVSRETKGRAGKGVSLITGLGLAPAELEKLCTQLKKRCGSGGTVKAGTIEIQGEHRDILVAELTRLGYAAKKAGG